MDVAHLQHLLEIRPYAFEAYEFVHRGLLVTTAHLAVARHVSGAELADGLRSYALEEFGPMAKHVLNSWGVHRTEDFGRIVFDLCEARVLRTSEDDRIEDFDDRYDFTEAFERDYYSRRRFLPESDPTPSV
jgi:uncharacterized repeat protein (TIGR04138 family)